MKFTGFPTVDSFQKESQIANDLVASSKLGTYAYVLDVVSKFSGKNAIPRNICNVLTQEYLMFSPRVGHEKEDSEQFGEVANQFIKAGFYVELSDSDLDRYSNSVSFLFCWDKQVLANNYMRGILIKEAQYNFYLNIMLYIRAEQNLPSIAKEQKNSIAIFGCHTKKWVSLPIISEAMYNDALVVASALWDRGYYVGLLRDIRRKDTWTLIVCWDTAITDYKGNPPVDFTFKGTVPSSWR